MSMTAVGVIAFVVIIVASVVLHEAGHFLTARRFGMKATEFFVGFGPRIWSIRRGETEYGLKAILAGGYVKIVGMTELEQVDPRDEHRAFYRHPSWQRGIVLVAGSLTHFVIAFALFLFAPLVFGNPEPTLTVDRVESCVSSDIERACGPDAPASPAKRAGLRVGDTVVSYDGNGVGSWGEFTDAIHAGGTDPTTMVVERGGREMTLRVEPVSQERGDTTVPVLGVIPRMGVERPGPVAAIGDSVESLGQAFAGTFRGLAQIPAALPRLADQVFGEEDRNVEGLVGVVGIAQISGEVLDVGSAPLSARIGSFLLIMGGLNVFIGIFNLLPLLPLDGGHLAVLGYEEGRRGVYRLLGRPDPGRVDVAKLLPIAIVFLTFLISLAVLLLAADILNPIDLR